ncbi:O-antigen polysaccharide polymerase Wzy [Clostridium perfringens]|uniref:O-antigen polysaccharide polymerase Wzy n=2 Tax=Clostridium perfringens TaxID=1502 RepID=UPI0039E95E10
MGKNISITKLILIFTYISINLLLITFLNNCYYKKDINLLTFISIIQLCINIIFLIRLGFEKLSLPILFVVFTYIFHLSQLLLYTFNIKMDNTLMVIDRVDIDTFLYYCIFTIVSQFLLCLGIGITKVKIKEKITKYRYINKDIIYKTGLYVFLLGFLPKVYTDLQKIIVAYSGNYLSTYNVGNNIIIQILSNCFEFGIYMILIGKQDNKRFCRKVFIIVLLYETIIMLSGNRGRAIVYIISLVFLYFKIIEKIKLKTSINIIILSYLIIIFINFISKIRMIELSNLNELVDILMSCINGNIFFETIAEFGGTLISLAFSFKFYPIFSNYMNGSSYILGIVSVIPNISKIINGINNKTIFTYNFPESYRFALGGSYLGELYANGGTFSIVLCFIIGIGLGVISNKIDKCIEEKDWFKLTFYMMLFPNIIWWIRAYFSDVVRTLMWSGLIIYFIYKLICKDRNLKL